ncbi:MAG: hypothetical protein ACHP6H_04165, partial [Legionellales bacterium]
RVSGQQNIPFKMGEMHLKLPVDLPALMKDSLAKKGDYLEYDVTGMAVTDTIAAQIHPVATSDRSTPWLVFGELLTAYQSGDIDKILALYTKNSHAGIRSYLADPDIKKKYFELVQSEKVIVPYFIMEWDNGYVAYAETHPGLTESFRFVKENNGFLLSSYMSKNQPVINNLFALYYYKPLPHQNPVIVQKPDSVTHSENPQFVVKLKRPSDYISVFIPKTGLAVILSAKDNGYNDSDPATGTVSMLYAGSKFPRGNYEVEVTESNYPVYEASNLLISAGTKFYIKVRE